MSKPLSEIAVGSAYLNGIDCAIEALTALKDKADD